MTAAGIGSAEEARAPTTFCENPVAIKAAWTHTSPAAFARRLATTSRSSVRQNVVRLTLDLMQEHRLPADQDPVLAERGSEFDERCPRIGLSPCGARKCARGF